ncbi:Predicted dehydrogenase [Paenibacillus sp. UNCCL117]|uniref:Gfo/Idh/MocA family protein n=1 Tax=unclassified Paenibacillus TaxID=185978 RepID=UPI0008856BB7|nr:MULTISPECIES: Gfo/Idh/MocA family oxidoreductase [unclassified Paenibacillus]SDC66316.1 Predicted dehydrogenase [Paenibacillus sp. cl123]SFW23003.1 Predicted dehydrogenase [Paenibacillus sp. UNCCL117]
MKAAVVGCGGMGRVHALAYAGMPDVQLTGVCDVNAGLARQLGELAGVPSFDSFDLLLAEAEFDVVSLTLPSHLHREYTIKAADAGKHIICEKPIALSSEDAKAMIDYCAERGVRLLIGHVVRFFPDYRHMHSVVTAGKLGRIGTLHAKRMGGHPGEAKPWFKDMSLSGGVIADLMIHDIDFVRWTLGDIKSVYALGRTSELFDYASVTLVAESGAVANLEACWGYPAPFFTAMEIAGSEGVVRADSRKTSSLHIRQTADPATGRSYVEKTDSPLYEGVYERELNHFISCLRTGAEADVTADDALKAVEIVEAALKSLSTGQAVYMQQQSTASKEETP